ncbi:MAG: inositol monophosphatase family protein [Luteibaculaceae bacterium]
MELEKLTKEVIKISQDIAVFIREEQQKVSSKSIEEKSENNFVTYVDKQAELKFVKQLEKLVPGAGFIAEEGTGEENAKGLNWIIDPLDGTTNFLHGIPAFSTSVALADGKDILLGVVQDINSRETFYAHKNGKAWLNGRQIKVSDTKILKNSLMATGFPYDDFQYSDQYFDLLAALTKKTRGLRRLGSAALDLVYVACGRFDAFYEYGLNSWDVAAGALIVKEAQGNVCDFKGGDSWLFGNTILATNSTIEKDMLQEIKTHFNKALL